MHLLSFACARWRMPAAPSPAGEGEETVRQLNFRSAPECQGDRIILARLLLLPLIGLPHKRRRAPVHAPRLDCVHTPTPWGKLSGSAALGHKPTCLAPA